MHISQPEQIARWVWFCGKEADRVTPWTVGQVRLGFGGKKLIERLLGLVGWQPKALERRVVDLMVPREQLENQIMGHNN